jgi:glycosyltransferase involved in cell wall biosynthesis
MKILHLIYDHIQNPWVGGGGAVRVRELYRRFSGRHEITVVCGRYPGAENHIEDNIRYEYAGSNRNNYILSTFCYAAKAVAYVKANSGDYDIVVEDFAPYNPVFSFLRHKKALIQLHQREGLRHLKKYALLGIPFYLVEKYYPRFFRNVLAELPSAKEIFGLRGNVAILPNGFDPKLLDLKTEEEDYMLFIGRFHINQKGLDTLSEAMRLVGRRLVIVGGGKDEERARSLFSATVAAGRAEFVGYAWGEKKEELMRKCLFMVVPSRYEGQPLIIMDTAACGKPVVVSDIPALKYAVDAGFGISFKTGDAKDLAEKILTLLGNQQLRLEMGKKAREYARDFSWDKIAEEYEKYLLGIVRETSGEKR